MRRRSRRQTMGVQAFGETCPTLNARTPERLNACRLSPGTLAALLAAAAPVWAHGEEIPVPEEWWRTWNGDPALLLTLALGSWLYGRGLLALWRQAGVGRGVSRARAAAFGGGLLALSLALLSPLDAMSAQLSSAHMVQHMTLMMVAAPLLVLGSPTLVFLWALPPRWRKPLGRWLHRLERPYSPWYLVWHPVLLWTLYAVTLWIWHLPVLYQAALRQPLVHDFQHLAFTGAAFLFWRVVLDPIGRLRLNRGAGVLYLFLTSLHASVLGVFMALSPRVWYLDYAATVTAWRLTPLEDQQLAGLIMWMPACMVYAVVAAVLFAAWLNEPEAREAR